MNPFGLLLAFAVVTAAAADSGRTLKPEDFAQLRDVDEPNLSPDGNLVVYVVKVADMEKDKRPGNLWLAKWDGHERFDDWQPYRTLTSLADSAGGYLAPVLARAAAGRRAAQRRREPALQGE